jgi:ABC-type antimicrobial peptide transport system permease subunit
MGEFAGHRQLINLFLILAGMSSILALLTGLVIGVVLSHASP